MLNELFSCIRCVVYLLKMSMLKNFAYFLWILLLVVYSNIYIKKYIVEIHTSNIIIEKITKPIKTQPFSFFNLQEFDMNTPYTHTFILYTALILLRTRLV